MNSPILSLKLFLFISSLVYPTYVFEASSFILGRRAAKNPHLGLTFGILLYSLLMLLLYGIYPRYFFFIFPHPLYILGAIMLAPLGIVIEYIIGYLFVCISTRNRCNVTISIHPLWKNVSYSLLIFSTIIVIFEEIIFRQLWFVALESFITSPVLIVLISSVVYGSNHAIFGIQALYQKTVCGLIYGLLYYYSGYSILVPILMHSCQNIMLGVVGRR